METISFGEQSPLHSLTKSNRWPCRGIEFASGRPAALRARGGLGNANASGFKIGSESVLQQNNLLGVWGRTLKMFRRTLRARISDWWGFIGPVMDQSPV